MRAVTRWVLTPDPPEPSFARSERTCHHDDSNGASLTAASTHASAVRRHELPQPPALRFVSARASRAGVTTSLEQDTPGRALGAPLLPLPVHLGHG